MRILVIDPAPASREQLCAQLTGFQTREAASVEAAARADSAHYAAIVANAELFDEANALLAFAGETPLVLVADAPSVQHAVDCMRQGAADYLPRPLDSGALATAVRLCIGDATPPSSPRSRDFANILGDSPPMRELFDAIHALGESDGPVLVRGESGSGKTLVAHALHAASRQRGGRLISLDCAAVPAATIAADLFGDGDPTAPPACSLAAAAVGGTLFLRAVEELPKDAQEMLTHALDSAATQLGNERRPVDVRWVAATRADLSRLARNGHFRSDLLAHLSASTLHVPPLRDRAGDVTTIATTVLARTAAKLDKGEARFSANALAALGSYPWPGNVRELENAVERAVALASGATIDADLLGIGAATASPPPTAPADAEDDSPTTSGSLESFFVRFVLDNQDQFTETELASRLGISRKSLWERRQRLNIPRRRTRQRGPRRR